MPDKAKTHFDTKNRPDLIAYSVTHHDDKSRFHSIGAGWANSRGGYGIRLHALPIDGEIVLLPPSDPKDEPNGP